MSSKFSVITVFQSRIIILYPCRELMPSFISGDLSSFVITLVSYIVSLAVVRVFAFSLLEIKTCMRAICWSWRMVGCLSSTLVLWAASPRERGAVSAVSPTEWCRKTSKSWLRYSTCRLSSLFVAHAIQVIAVSCAVQFSFLFYLL